MQFAAVVMFGSQRSIVEIVELEEKAVVFGRIAEIADVSLPGPVVAKRLFEIRWNTDHNRHEVEVYPCVCPPSLNGDLLKSAGDCRPLSVGDVVTIDQFRIEYTVRPTVENKMPI